ncbi:translational activator of cytochrome c oxidase 1 [Eudromia elegans]
MAAARSLGSLRALAPPLGPPPGRRRLLHVAPPACAGHNRWSKVRTQKGPRDAARGRLFQRLGAQICGAAREGGRDPAHNAALAQVLQQCRAHNMPKATVEAALRRAEAASPLVRFLVGARGPGGSAWLLEVLTDDERRSRQGLRDLLGQHGAVMAEGVHHFFEEVTELRVAPRDLHGRPVTMEAALEAALEVGAQDVYEDEDEEDEEGPSFKTLAIPLTTIGHH